MPEAGFELTITASERAKTVHALDCSATMTGQLYSTLTNYVLCHKNIWGSGGIAPPFLTSATDGSE
jgi:hypothetical protein